MPARDEEKDGGRNRDRYIKKTEAEGDMEEDTEEFPEAIRQKIRGGGTYLIHKI